jgi:hypothetical protein
MSGSMAHLLFGILNKLTGKPWDDQQFFVKLRCRVIKLEKKLENWLAQRSLAQILDWFDCIETTRVQTAMGNYRWSTESVARDKLFLKYLGVGDK